jgi:hypothetical protein
MLTAAPPRFAYRGWSVLLLAPMTALIAAGVAREPLLAHWTQTFMGGAAGFLAQFFPLFLLGALFGKLMGRQRRHRAVGSQSLGHEAGDCLHGAAWNSDCAIGGGHTPTPDAG